MKVLIIRFSSIGDIVLTTPVIRCLKMQVPDIELHYLTKENYYPVVRDNPYLTKVHLFSSPTETARELLKEQFDLVIDLHRNIRSYLVTRKLHAPVSRFDKLNVLKWKAVYLKKKGLPDAHIVERYLAAAGSLGVVNDKKGLDYFIPEEDEVRPEHLPVTHMNGYVAFVIGGAHKTKCMPDDMIQLLCKRLDLPVVLLGGKESFALAERIARSYSDRVINYCGKFNLNQSASVVKYANMVVTHDTGLMHIAAAFRKNILSVWGNTVPEFGMYPYMPGDEDRSVMIENKALRCRPCSKIGYDKCPRKHFNCMRQLDMDTIVQKAQHLYHVPAEVME